MRRPHNYDTLGWRLFDWAFTPLGFIIMFVVILLIAGAFNYWAYDGDIKCLVAECRRIKDRD